MAAVLRARQRPVARENSIVKIVPRAEPAQRAIDRRRQVAALLQITSDFSFAARPVTEITERRLYGVGRGFGGSNFSFLERQNNLLILSDFALFLFFHARCGRRRRRFYTTFLHAGFLHHFGDDFSRGLGMFLQKVFSRFTSLANALTSIGVPGAAFFDDVLFAA